MAEWRRYPPLRVAVAQFLGYKPPPELVAAADGAATAAASFELPYED